MMSDDETVEDDFTNLATLVALGKTIKAASEDLGVSLDRAYHLSRQDDFKPTVYRVRTERTEALAAQALAAAEEAIITLRAIAGTAEKDSDRIAAANAILKQVLPLAENTELRRRLDAVEQRTTETTDGD
jgi:hypothetical protein